MKRLPCVAVLLLLLVGFWAPVLQAQEGDDEGADGGEAPAQHGPPPSPVTTDPAVMETVQRMRRVTGQIQPRRRSIVASQEDGLVILVPFDAGAVVKKGEVLARLDSTLLELQLAELEARLMETESMISVRQSELDQVQSDLRSLSDLSERGAAKPKELSDAQSDVVAAQGRFSGASRAAAYVRAQVNSIAKRLEHKTIVAPFEGTIISKMTEVGQWVQEGGAVVELIESGMVDAVMAVPETYINLVKLDMRVAVTLPAFGTPFEGRVRAIVPMGDARAHTYPVKVALSDQAGLIKPLMTAEVWVPTGMSEHKLTIRKDAILQNDTGPYVYVARNGAAAMVPIRLLYSAGTERVVVASNLQPGELVIFEGNERLYPSAPVRPIERTQVTATKSTGEEPG